MTELEEVRAAVHEVIAQILPALSADEIDGRKHLRDLGADSVDRVEIILGLLDRLDVDESLASFSDVPNVDALVAFLCEVRP